MSNEPTALGLLGSLVAYLRHDTQCRSHENMGCGPCTCGLQDAHFAYSQRVRAALRSGGAPQPTKACDPCLRCFKRHDPTDTPCDHVCGLMGYDGMCDPPCPGCEYRDEKWAKEQATAGPQQERNKS